MARHAKVVDGTQRRYTRRWRKGLSTKGEPEVGRVDTAVTVALYGYLRKVKAERRQPEGHADLAYLLERALDVLESQGYSRQQSKRVLMRRLVKPSKRFDGLLADDGPDDDDNASPGGLTR